MKLIQDKLEKLRKFLAEQPVELAYVFGSSVSGQTGAMSDIDVAVLLTPSAEEAVDFFPELKILAGLKKILKTDKVDLTILNTAAPVLKREAALLGEEIYSKNPDVRFEFEQRVLQEYEDTAVLRNIFYQTLEERIKQGNMGI